jgi:hypothetical protein
LRLNSKALFKPSLKEEKLIIIDDDIPEKIPEITKKERMAIKTLREMPIRKTRKEKQQQPVAKVESSQSDDGIEQDLTYSLEIQELSESYKEETTSLSKPVKKDIVEEASSKGHKYGTRPKKPKLSIDLNRHASEEDQDEHRAETKDAPGKQRTEEFQIAIKELKQENQTLETWNAKL